MDFGPERDVDVCSLPETLVMFLRHSAILFHFLVTSVQNFQKKTST